MSLLLRSNRVSLLRPFAVSVKPKAFASGSISENHKAELELIGQREIVGYGVNGEANYIDRADYPCPAVRWRPATPDIQALREKEKGDWKKLSIQEKKQLYRASFCQTLSETYAPTGEWKSVAGSTLFFLALSIWMFMGLKMFVYPELPSSFSLESRQAQLRRMIDMQVNPVEGLASKWDYEKDDWKK